MFQTGSTSGHRTSAVYLLVFCLISAALTRFASQTFPDRADVQLSGIAAPEDGIALVLGDRTENPAHHDLQSAAFGRFDGLRFLRGGRLLPGTTDTARATLIASATGIRGPPPAANR